MFLADRLSGRFSREIQRRGSDYFHGGRVRIVDSGQVFVAATVRGTSRYRVDLQADGSSVSATCTCPYYADYGACKHVWAVVLASDKAGHLQSLDDSDAGPVYAERARAEAEPDGNWSDLRLANPRPWHPEFAPEPRRADWRALLAAANEATAPVHAAPPAHRRVLYIINAPLTLRGFGLSLEVALQHRKQSGEWGKPRSTHVDHPAVLHSGDAVDRTTAAILRGATSPYGNGRSYTNGLYGLGPDLADLLIPKLGAAGRLYLRTREGGDTEPLVYEEGPPWVFVLNVDHSGKRGASEITGSLKRGDEVRRLDEPLMLVDGWVFWSDRVDRLDAGGVFGWMATLRAQQSVSVPAAQEAEFLKALYESALESLPLNLPADMQVEVHSPSPRPVLNVRRPHGGHDPLMLAGVVSAAYDGIRVPVARPGGGMFDPATRTRVRRALDAEAGFLGRLHDLGCRAAEPVPMGLVPHDVDVPSRQLPHIVQALLEEGWAVEADGNLYRRPGILKFTVTSGIDWFDLDAQCDFDGVSVSLPRILAALKKGDHTVRLDDGSYGILPEDWLAKHASLAALGHVEGEHLRFKRQQSGVLDALLAVQPEATCDAVFQNVRTELRAFSSIQPVEAPAGFHGELRTYQKEGLGWLAFLEKFGFGGCLADDMGLGKTIQVLAFLEQRAEAARTGGGARRLPSLVVVPRSLIFNWQREAARFTPALRVLDYTGTDRVSVADRLADVDLVLTTYGTLRSDIVRLKEMEFDCLILDEAQAIKNAQTASAKAVRLLKGRFRLALSGTPIENHVGELWSLFEFLNPGMLGAASVFKAGTASGAVPEPATQLLLARALRPFILRRTKGQVAKELPSRIEETLMCDLEGAQRKLYDDLRAHYRASLLGRVDREGLGKTKFQVLEALLRLRQAACHPGLLDPEQRSRSSAKLDTLLPLLREVAEEDHKTLVFSQFTSFLSIVRERLDAEGVNYEYLDGRTRDREAHVTRFQEDPACKLFLISLKAGGLGLNLTAAEYVFLLDPWWNPAVEAQAIDRAHRIGQTRQVFAYRLIARDTVEERILDLQRTKRDLAEAIITADNSLIRTLRREDLELLLA